MAQRMRNQAPPSEPDKATVFVVHGRNLDARREFFSLLRALGLKPLEWEAVVARLGQGSPLIPDVIERGFRDAYAVVVLLTGDEEARLRNSFLKVDDSKNEAVLQRQPRQNVLFEAGMAFGRFPERTVLVEINRVRLFSDILGRLIVRLDDSFDKRLELAQRLAAIGCPVDISGRDWTTAGKFSSLAESPLSVGVLDQNKAAVLVALARSDSTEANLGKMLGFQLSRLKIELRSLEEENFVIIERSSRGAKIRLSKSGLAALLDANLIT